MAFRRFELVDAQSNKYWEIWCEGTEVHTHYGKIGTAGKLTVKDEGSQTNASKLHDKLIAQKTAKGYVEVAGGDAPVMIASKQNAPASPMSESLFWDLIARFDWKKTGDDDGVLRPTVTALAGMQVEDIFAFDDLLAEKLYALDTRDVCRGIYRDTLDPDDGDDYISADDFLYQRCVIVANGKALFDAVLSNPRVAPQGLEFEALLRVAWKAYEKKTGKEYDRATRLSWESFSNEAGWVRAEASRPGRFTGPNIPPGNRRPT
jgi:predicted DNA-binding WGR domain protein